jgi:hypothetical protein
MEPSFSFGREFFAELIAVDDGLAAAVAAAGCRWCGGALHRGDYERKPRWGLLGVGLEGVGRRRSLCCGEEGCRRRTLPPSVVFLGRRVYLGAVVIAASVVALALGSRRASRVKTGVPVRTTRRWLAWWQNDFPLSATFVWLAARLVPAVRVASLPTSLLERLSGEAAARIGKLCGHLAASPDGSRFARDTA